MDRRLIVLVPVALAALAMVFLWNTGPGGRGTVTENSPQLGFLNVGGVNRLDPEAFDAQITAIGLGSEMEFSRLERDLALEAGATWDRAGLFYVNGQITGGGGASGLNVMATISPAPRWAGDAQRFQAAVQGFVRANGNIRYWQLGNEPDLRARTTRQWTPESYSEFFLAGEKAVRSACPDCKIVLAGISNQFDSGSDNVDFYRRALSLIKDGGGDFEVFDMHFWKRAGEESLAASAVETYRALLDETDFGGREIWATEVGTYSGAPQGMPAQTEDEQASYLVKSFALLAAEDVSVIMWGRLIENYRFANNEDGYFDHTGLVYDGVGDEAGATPGGTKKKAFHSFKTMAARFQGVLTIEKVAPTVVRFAGSGTYFYIAWGSGAFADASRFEGRVRVTGMDGSERVAEAASLQLTDSPVFIDQL